MQTDDFDFELPAECIALRPAVPRESARLLVIGRHRGIIAETTIADLPLYLRGGDALIVNDTRVIACALKGYRQRGEARVALNVMLHRRARENAWWAFAKPGRRLAVDDKLVFSSADEKYTLMARLCEKGESGEVLLEFDRAGVALDQAVAAVGDMPLPPYIASRRAADQRDRSDYQTIYASRDGSVAAPTAGLHLTEKMMTRLAAHEIGLERVTLHVGGGTFLPVKSAAIADHRMHAEWGEIDGATAARLAARRAGGGRMIAIGTTAARLLESAARPSGAITAFRGETDIFMTPGYRFAAVDGLMTNFHLPRSTLFMLVCAFAGYDVMRHAYAHAIATGYRFFSYGDACLLLPEG
ncbi:MAG: tRNA preQ1(34) S-adenosylmethionine ribosyltransferase-isomerase QueA [Hyphomicrobiales bacterium]|nr:tRNA preQ1(34) S-adenosylmethionine ribosyltransferase-isomerase QueA [Hyphomicrobiales bacterium]OQW83262.1 MAG: tRNA preQ1(34) S-adenosylmethionine ribosyltransferase-isomerase QueA [Proteobacteria bacterium ST_bin15]